jgi:predicted small secreted protein
MKRLTAVVLAALALAMALAGCAGKGRDIHEAEQTSASSRASAGGGESAPAGAAGHSSAGTIERRVYDDGKGGAAETLDLELSFESAGVHVYGDRGNPARFVTIESGKGQPGCTDLALRAGDRVIYNGAVPLSLFDSTAAASSVVLLNCGEEIPLTTEHLRLMRSFSTQWGQFVTERGVDPEDPAAAEAYLAADHGQGQPGVSSAAYGGGTGGAGGSGGTVQVRGYTRSNGTYVHGYTRSAPGRGSGGRR